MSLNRFIYKSIDGNEILRYWFVDTNQLCNYCDSIFGVIIWGAGM